ncbi:MAG: TenA family protein [Symploca sp. SIO3C6]|uniref:TenA family protein n=1 Tax=Symploca sp. SIO1C4 TaxID=2607765 RepID=A0A6B3N6W5_9CYAN|nr:TenA family protein [Symploca sp. SIO3C6]NER27350.1 TenA family protein [Symploca sp. SIO1C4]
MAISADLWQSNQDIAQQCLKHPFIQGIATGNLESSKFAYYVAQDFFFLEAFARAYSLAAAKSDDWEGFNTFHSLAGGVIEELKLHKSYANLWGVDWQQVEPTTATRRYTDFLMATAWGSDISLIATAMTPCMRLYTFLGQQLAKDGIGNHQYTEWIRTYSNQEFEKLAQRLENLTNRCPQLTASIKSTYRYAMLCELDFFEAAWES